MNNHLVANPTFPSYMPDPHRNFSRKMCFWQRLINTFSYIVGYFIYYVMYFPKHNTLMHSYFPNAPPLNDLMTNTSLLFLNSHPSINQAVPHTPNMIEIGGMHVKPAKKLPDDLQKFLEFLAHPNVKLFVTHGGLLSLIETIHYGVPMVGMPIFAEQAYNMQENVMNGIAVKIEYDELNVDTLYEAMNTVLTNKSYSENVKIRSKKLHDQPLKPLDVAVYWTEYVIRHKGAAHLRSAAHDLSLYQYLLLDVNLVIALVAIVIIAIYIKCFMVASSFIYLSVTRKLKPKKKVLKKKVS